MPEQLYWILWTQLHFWKYDKIPNLVWSMEKPFERSTQSWREHTNLYESEVDEIRNVGYIQLTYETYTCEATNCRIMSKLGLVMTVVNNENFGGAFSGTHTKASSYPYPADIMASKPYHCSLMERPHQFFMGWLWCSSLIILFSSTWTVTTTLSDRISQILSPFEATWVEKIRSDVVKAVLSSKSCSLLGRKINTTIMSILFFWVFCGVDHYPLWLSTQPSPSVRRVTFDTDHCKSSA